MKKIFTFLLLCAAAFGGCLAQQVGYYKFSENVTGSYSSLESATVVGLSDKVKGINFGNVFFNASDTLRPTNENDPENPAHMAGIPIGFDFQFGGRTYDKFVVSGQGYVLLGKKGEEDVSIAGTDLQVQLGIAPWIGIATNDDIFGSTNTRISYKKEGTSPNSVLTVEFLLGGKPECHIQLPDSIA